MSKLSPLLFAHGAIESFDIKIAGLVCRFCHFECSEKDAVSGGRVSDEHAVNREQSDIIRGKTEGREDDRIARGGSREGQRKLNAQDQQDEDKGDRYRRPGNLCNEKRRKNKIIRTGWRKHGLV